MKTAFVLASASPRRQELLARLGVPFSVDVASTDEGVRSGERPHDYVRRVAEEKATTVAERHPDALVLAADTSVVLGRSILGKPKNAEDAKVMLTRLSGVTHRVLTAVALAGASRDGILVSTEVDFRPLSAEEVEWYVRTGEPMDKAGSYAIQGTGGFFVKAIRGSHSNVIGLPLVETVELLRGGGLKLPWS
ncbi:MAG: Maf family protein [Myxococcaceae bacterium]